MLKQLSQQRGFPKRAPKAIEKVANLIPNPLDPKERGFYGDIVKQVVVGKVVKPGPILAAREETNKLERIKDAVKPPKTYEAPTDINFAQLSKASYEKNPNIYGYTHLKEYSSPDRTVWRHNNTGHVVVAFRGTNTKNWRDVTSDALLALGQQGLSHRFYNAKQVTEALIKKYGKENVSVTGHSLGGSEALYVSRKYGVNAHVFNPHVSWDEALTHANYKHAHLYFNKTDPVAAFSRGANFKSVTARTDPSHGFGLKQHGIDYWVKDWQKQHPHVQTKPSLISDIASTGRNPASAQQPSLISSIQAYGKSKTPSSYPQGTYAVQ